MAQTTAHIIRNDEIGLTECGRLILADVDPNSQAPVPMGRGEVALWDNAERPTGSTCCQACWTAYIIEAR